VEVDATEVLREPTGVLLPRRAASQAGEPTAPTPSPVEDIYVYMFICLKNGRG